MILNLLRWIAVLALAFIAGRLMTKIRRMVSIPLKQGNYEGWIH